jgi:alpha-1,6-mannosyltransferase
MIRCAPVRLTAGLRRVAGSGDDVAFTVAVGAGYAVLFGVAFLVERGLRDDAIAGSASRSSQLLGFAGYAAVFVGVTVLYGCLLLRLHEGGVERHAWWLMLGIPVGLHVALWATPPLLSIDLLSYVGHGHIAAAGGNPYRTPVAVLEGTPFGNQLASYGWAPSAGVTPYGPLWTDIEALALHLTHGVRSSFLFLKAVTSVASLGTAVVIWLALRGSAPRLQRLATVAWLWNPVVLGELPGEGHNDVLMAFFAIAALALLVHGHPAPSGLSLSLAVLTKFLPLILLPPFVAYLRRRREPADLLRFASGLGLGLAAAVVLYWPFWAGEHTFDGVREASRISAPRSTAGFLWAGLSRVVSDATASWVTRDVVDFSVAAFVVAVSFRVRDERSLFAACAAAALAYVFIATPTYWPWYVVLSLALVAVAARESFLLLIMVAVSLGSRLAAPLDNLSRSELLTPNELWVGMAMLGVVLPLGFTVAAWAWRSAAKRAGAAC